MKVYVLKHAEHDEVTVMVRAQNEKAARQKFDEFAESMELGEDEAVEVRESED